MASTFVVSNGGVSPSVDDIELSFVVRTDDPTLKQLLADGQARYSLRWRCTATLATDEHEPQTRATLHDGYRFGFWLDQRQVRGSVTADIRVLVVQPLTGFRWERQHPDYGNAVFDLGVGDVLADGGSITFEANKLYDPLDPPIGSCFKFVQDAELRRGIRVTFEEDEVILVRLAPELHSNLGLLAPRPRLQISSVVLPALIQAVSFIQGVLQDKSEDLDDRVWFRAIRDAAGGVEGFEKPAIEIAQRILAYPVDSTLAVEADAEEDDE